MKEAIGDVTLAILRNRLAVGALLGIGGLWYAGARVLAMLEAVRG